MAAAINCISKWVFVLSGSLLCVLLTLPLLIPILPRPVLHHPLLLAPMIDQTEPCHTRAPLPPEHDIDPAFTQCTSEQGSAAAVIESTLAQLGPRLSPNSRYELGYTLNVPLLKFWVQRDGQWVLDRPAIARMVKTIEQSDRRLILYFFSTHFSSSAPIEPVLAADPANVAVTQNGPLGMGKHFGMGVYPWSVARTDNSLTRARTDVIQAFIDAVCQHPSPDVQRRIEGITLLGEVHHLFPDFEAGMGFDGPYLITDYSPRSLQQFQTYLRKRFGSTTALNQALGGASFTDFLAVTPPAKDIRRDPLQHYWEHIDAYAAGSLPVAGWVAPDQRLTGWVNIYVNGRSHARVRAGLGRQDVKEQLPHLPNANVGWRHDLDFRTFQPGIYEVTTLAETHEGQPILLGSRNISVMDRDQSTPKRIASQDLPAHARMSNLQASMDLPAPDMAFFYNPLAAMWRDFREQQVVNYLQFMAQPLRHSCLSDTPRYIHQLFPYPNPSWDAAKFAVSQSLTQKSDLRLGISLYGESSYGQSFFDWKHRVWPPGKAPHPKIYGITEFHPLRGMEPVELRNVFDRHRQEGAQFLSFFLEGRGPVNRPYNIQEPTIPLVGEANTQNGSNQIYRSIQNIMQQP
jgi:hypothetical protein